MLKVYRPIDHKIKDVQKLIEFLVFEVWCKADRKLCKTHLNNDIKNIYQKEEYGWFKDSIDDIYKLFRKLDQNEKNIFRQIFINNNEIEKLCNGTNTPIYINTFNPVIRKAIVDFFSELYVKFLGWKYIKDNYGSKKVYYDNLVSKKNKFIECPCCGYGDIKTRYSKGHSPYDHYLPQKYYPLSSINFENLVPLCHICNSDYKGEKDIIKNKANVVFPFSNIHSKIELIINFDGSKIHQLITFDDDDNFEKKIFDINFNIKSNEIESWDRVFDIKDRYQGKIADNRVGWFKDVKTKYNKDIKRIPNYSVEDAFNDIIEDDSNKQYGFIKSPYLKKLKTFAYLIKAVEEVSGSSKI